MTQFVMNRISDPRYPWFFQEREESEQSEKCNTLRGQKLQVQKIPTKLDPKL